MRAVLVTLALAASLAAALPSHAAPPDDRARAALALAAAAPVAPCGCVFKQRCDCVECDCAVAEETRWRRAGWQKDAAGQWYRLVPNGTVAAPVVAPPAYHPAPVAFAPVPAFAPRFAFGGAACGPGG